jgi:hypothetical protein
MLMHPLLWICASAAINFPQKISWQISRKVLDTGNGRAGPVMSARLCASYEKHGDQDFSPFGYPAGLI